MDKIIVHGGSPSQRFGSHQRVKEFRLCPSSPPPFLPKDECVISRVPDLSDIHFMLTILSELGCEVEEGQRYGLGKGHQNCHRSPL